MKDILLAGLIVVNLVLLVGFVCLIIIEAFFDHEDGLGWQWQRTQPSDPPAAPRSAHR